MMIKRTTLGKIWYHSATGVFFRNIANRSPGEGWTLENAYFDDDSPDELPWETTDD